MGAAHRIASGAANLGDVRVSIAGILKSMAIFPLYSNIARRVVVDSPCVEKINPVRKIMVQTIKKCLPFNRPSINKINPAL